MTPERLGKIKNLVREAFLISDSRSRDLFEELFEELFEGYDSEDGSKDFEEENRRVEEDRVRNEEEGAKKDRSIEEKMKGHEDLKKENEDPSVWVDAVNSWVTTVWQNTLEAEKKTLAKELAYYQNLKEYHESESKRLAEELRIERGKSRAETLPDRSEDRIDDDWEID